MELAVSAAPVEVRSIGVSDVFAALRGGVDDFNAAPLFGLFFGGVYVNHRDHRGTGMALLDAVAPACAMPLYFPEAGPAHRVPTLLLSGTLAPDAYVDISATIADKLAAVGAHRSQLDDDHAWVARTVRARAEEDGRLAGVLLAEGFRLLELDV